MAPNYLIYAKKNVASMLLIFVCNKMSTHVGADTSASELELTSTNKDTKSQSV